MKAGADIAFEIPILHDSILDKPYEGIDANLDGVLDCAKPPDSPWEGLESEGTYYRTMTKITGGSYQSICAADYGKVLGDVKEMTISINESSIVLPKDFLKPQERIAAIYLDGVEMKDGVEVILTYPTIQFLQPIPETSKVTFRIERIAELPRTLAAVAPEDGGTLTVDPEEEGDVSETSKYATYLKRLFSKFLGSH